MLIVLASKDAQRLSWPGCNKAAAAITIQTSQKWIVNSDWWTFYELWKCIKSEINVNINWSRNLQIVKQETWFVCYLDLNLTARLA